MMSTVTRRLIASQTRLSRTFDTLLPERFRVDGMQHFIHYFAPKYLGAHLRVYDVGGGKRPYINPAQKRELDLCVVGLDIDRREMTLAPPGTYDEIVCADISSYRGQQDADLVICLAVLEHVPHVEGALAAIASMLRVGGKAIIFVPSGNAIFARANRLLPQELKRTLLTLLRGERTDVEGFPAHYDRCTPCDFARLGRANGLEVVELCTYYISSYFSLFFPAYLLWRFWILGFYLLKGEQAAESFSVAFEKCAESGRM